MTSQPFAGGGYRFIPAVFQYSGGVAAQPGFAIERVSLRTPLPLREGFARMAEVIRARGRPLTALCACELRSPAPFTDRGFRSFNEAYVAELAAWEIYDPVGCINPVARSNVCPALAPPSEVCLHAFSFTVPGALDSPTFVIAGSGEAREGTGEYRSRTVRYGETSSDALGEKAGFVVGEMERRLSALGVSWAEVSATQVYTVHNIHSFLAEAIVRRGAAPAGVTWHLCRPPVIGLEFEMDCRGIGSEHNLP